MTTPECKIWVIDDNVNTATFERLGDARDIANSLHSDVGVFIIGPQSIATETLSQHGANHIVHVICPDAGCVTKVNASLMELKDYKPRLILASGQPKGREWAARLAVRGGWQLVSPALVAHIKNNELVITALSNQGKFCRKVHLDNSVTAVITLKPGVAELRTEDSQHCPTVVQKSIAPEEEQISIKQKIPANPETVDIRYASRLVAGGRGLGNAQGFNTLKQFAESIQAGIAASRMAVDLGWIDHQRQVGQTGKTVKPDLYIACGISGASHHLAGMSEAKHIVAINTDPQAPIFQFAHLGLVADLYEVLESMKVLLR